MLLFLGRLAFWRGCERLQVARMSVAAVRWRLRRLQQLSVHVLGYPALVERVPALWRDDTVLASQQAADTFLAPLSAVCAAVGAGRAIVRLVVRGLCIGADEPLGWRTHHPLSDMLRR